MSKRPKNWLLRESWHCKTCDLDLPISAFNRRRNRHGEMVHRYNCRECEVKGRFKHGGQTGYVKLTDRVWDIFDECARRLDNQAEFARRIDTTPRNLGMILWRKRTFVQKRRVMAAILLLRELRRENVWTTTSRAHKRWSYADEFRCRECGTDLENTSEDCSMCWERKRGRERRADPVKSEQQRAYDRKRRPKVDSPRT